MGTRTFERKCELGSECSVSAHCGPAEAGPGNPQPNSLLKKPRRAGDGSGSVSALAETGCTAERSARRRKGVWKRRAVGVRRPLLYGNPSGRPYFCSLYFWSYPPSNLSCFLTPFPSFFSLLQILLSHPLKCLTGALWSLPVQRLVVHARVTAAAPLTGLLAPVLLVQSPCCP